MNQPLPPGAALKHSGFGIASLLLGVLNVLGAIVSVVLFVVIIGAILYIAVMLSALLGLLLGVIGLVWRHQQRRRGVAIAGIVLNLLALLPFAIIRFYN